MCMVHAVEKDVGSAQFLMQWVTTLCRQAGRKQAGTKTAEGTKEHTWIFSERIQLAPGNKNKQLAPWLLLGLSGDC